MAATYVQSAKFIQAAPFNPANGTMLSPVSAGNLLVLTAVTHGGATTYPLSITDTLGNTWINAFPSYQGGANCVVSLWYVLQTLGGTLTVHVSATTDGGPSTMTFTVAEYSGTSSSAALVASNSAGNNTNTHPSPGAISGTGADVVVAMGGQGIAAWGSLSVASPQTLRQSNPDGLTQAAIVYSDNPSPSGSETPTFTTGNSLNWASCGASFKVASPNPVVPPTPPPIPVPPPTPPPTPPPEVAPQTTQSGRSVTLVAVVAGNVYVTQPGGVTWTPALNSTGLTLVTSGVVRSASNIQKLWFADGTNYLYYDPSVNSVLVWAATHGVLPVDSSSNKPRLICTWRGRTVLSGLLLDGQNWFMSAVSDPTNYDYFPFPQLPTQAVAGNNSTLGIVGDVITSLVPYSDDILIFGGDHTLWQLQGDPFTGGQIMRLSDSIGMAWGNAWCRDPYGTLYFVSNQTGIYSLQIGQGPPLRISQQIEQFLVNINTGKNIIRCQWDDYQQGFHVYVTLASGVAATTHFFWEQRTGAWWTDTFSNLNHNPLCCVSFDGNTPQDRRALIGSWDGYVRTTSRDALTDDGTGIDTAVVLGPLLTKDLDDILAKDLQAVLGETSGSVHYSVYVGATAEIALSRTPVASGTWTAGRNYNSFVRYSGHAIWVKISSTNAWAMETVRARIVGLNKVRGRGK